MLASMATSISAGGGENFGVCQRICLTKEGIDEKGCEENWVR